MKQMQNAGFAIFDKRFIYAAHRRIVRGVYIYSRLFRILALAELFGIFHLFTLFLEEFDYTPGGGGGVTPYILYGTDVPLE